MYGHVVTKFSRMGRLLHFLTHGAPLARFVRESSAMKTLFFVESVKFSCISLAEKLHATFDGMKGISRPSTCFIKKKSLARAAESPITALRRSFFGKIICSKKKRQVCFSLNGEIK